MEEMCFNFIVNALSADGLASPGAMTSTDIFVTNFSTPPHPPPPPP